MLALVVYLQLLAISFLLSVFIFWLKSKTKKQFLADLELFVAPIISCTSFFFGASDDYKIRIHIIFALLFFYLISCVFCHYILFGKVFVGSVNSERKLSVTLPIEKKFDVDSKFIEDLPYNVDSLTHMCENISQLTREFIVAFNNQQDDGDKDVCLKSFFFGICNHIATLFDFHTRVHVRILTSSAYEKYVASEEQREYTKKMSDMSLQNGMIWESYNNKCSLIKSLNTNLHEEGKNKSRKWKNYLMFALPQITHCNAPVFSVGISVKKKKNDLLFFLNYCEIESIIGAYIDEIVEQCALVDFVESYYFKTN